jgi:hypothetical protein
MSFYKKASITKRITKEYMMLSLEAHKEDTWVQDNRAGNLLGPFKTAKEGREMATKLNEMVQRNGVGFKPFTLHAFDGTLLEEA